MPLGYLQSSPRSGHVGGAVALCVCGLVAGAAAQPAAPPKATSTPAGSSPTTTPAAPPTAGPPPAPAPRRPRKVIVEPPPPVPDPRALSTAGESNLQPTGHRAGWALGIALVAVQQVGTFDGSSRAAGGVLRFGKPATPDTELMIEIFGFGFPQSSSDSYIRSSQALSLIGLTYLAPTFWVRYGGGLASVSQAVRDTTKVDVFYDLKQRFGVGAVFGGGIDVVHWRSTRFALENTIAIHRFAQGWIVDLGIGFSLTRY